MHLERLISLHLQYITHKSVADCGASDANDWVEISAVSSEVDKADGVEMDIASHMTSAKRLLDDICGRVAALKTSEKMTAGIDVMSDKCDTDVSTNM